MKVNELVGVLRYCKEKPIEAYIQKVELENGERGYFNVEQIVDNLYYFGTELEDIEWYITLDKMDEGTIIEVPAQIEQFELFGKPELY